MKESSENISIVDITRVDITKHTGPHSWYEWHCLNPPETPHMTLRTDKSFFSVLFAGGLCVQGREILNPLLMDTGPLTFMYQSFPGHIVIYWQVIRKGLNQSVKTRARNKRVVPVLEGNFQNYLGDCLYPAFPSSLYQPSCAYILHEPNWPHPQISQEKLLKHLRRHWTGGVRVQALNELTDI